MRKLLTNFIGPNKAMPIKHGTLDHIQLAYQEAINALGQSQIGKDYDPTKVYILYGCVNTLVAPNYNISAGAVFYNGEVYLVDTVAFVAADTAVGTITVSYFANATADPVTFTDGAMHNVHEIKKMVIADGVSGSGDADFEDWINNNFITDLSPTMAVSGGSGTATLSNESIKYFVGLKYVILNYFVTITCTGNGSVGVTIALPVLAALGFDENSCTTGISSAGANFLFNCGIVLAGSGATLFGYGLINGDTYQVGGQIIYERR